LRLEQAEDELKREGQLAPGLGCCPVSVLRRGIAVQCSQPCLDGRPRGIGGAAGDSDLVDRLHAGAGLIPIPEPEAGPGRELQLACSLCPERLRGGRRGHRPRILERAGHERDPGS